MALTIVQQYALQQITHTAEALINAIDNAASHRVPQDEVQSVLDSYRRQFVAKKPRAQS